jgi:spoIIIJ-associated protein
LGLTADKVSVEVLDAGNKGLFGLGKPQVRVRLTVIPEGGAAAVEAKPAVREPEAKPAVQAKARPVDQPKAKPVDPTPVRPDPVKETESNLEHDPLLDHTEAVISRLINLLHLKAQVSAHYGEQDREGRRDIHVDIRGDDLSVLIGKHSETLNAFQFVASLIVGRDTEDWVQLVIDVEGYRDRRQKQLIQMATRLAEQVMKSGKRMSLEPMPSAERRIIHIALREHPEVKTESTGEEPHRKVTIVPKES